MASFVTLAQAPTHAQPIENNSNSGYKDVNYHDILMNVTTVDVYTLSDEQIELANKLYDRIYNLYPDSYHQIRIDQVLSYFASSHNQLNMNSYQKLKTEKLVECMSDLNKLENYKVYLKLHTQGFVLEHDIDEVKDTLEILNYFFVDELAKAQMRGNLDNLGADAEQRLDEEGLTELFYEFKNELEYEDMRLLAGLDLDETEPYSLMSIYFTLLNEMLCEDLIDR